MKKEEKLEIIKAQINEINDKVASLKDDKDELMVKAANLCKFKKGDKVVQIKGNQYSLNNKALIVYETLFCMFSGKIQITTKQIKRMERCQNITIIVGEKMKMILNFIPKNNGSY